MINPKLSKKNNNVLTISENAKKLFSVIFYEQRKNKTVDDELPKIKVSRLISKMAFYYEKIRNTVDYKEEHLLRKNAIARILRRQILIEGVIKESKSENIAKHLLTELIRAGYLPNNQILESRVDEVSKILSRYFQLKKHIPSYLKDKNKWSDYFNWIIALAASEIEEHLCVNKVNQTVISNMYEILLENIRFPENNAYQEDREIQIYLGVYRSFLKYDPDMLSFIVLKYYYPNWQDAQDNEIEDLAEDIVEVREKINKQINHSLTKQLNRVISRYTVFFTILVDTIDDDPKSVYEKFISNPKAFARQIKQKCEKRYKSTRSKLWRAAARSILYIFITKSVFAAILEIPAIKWFGGEFNGLAMVINVVFPPLLLFTIVLFSRKLTADNTTKIIQGIEEIVFVENKRKEPFRLGKPIKRSAFMNTMFGIIYFVTFFLSFGFIVWGLNKIGFHWISITIFLFFLALVSFFSIRIRKGIKELTVIEPKENIITLFGDFFYTPIIVAGKWLSEKFSKINIFVFILDFIIEAPFKIFVEVAEQWTKYVKERKDEIS